MWFKSGHKPQCGEQMCLTGAMNSEGCIKTAGPPEIIRGGYRGWRAQRWHPELSLALPCVLWWWFSSLPANALNGPMSLQYIPFLLKLTSAYLLLFVTTGIANRAWKERELTKILVGYHTLKYRFWGEGSSLPIQEERTSLSCMPGASTRITCARRDLMVLFLEARAPRIQTRCEKLT